MWRLRVLGFLILALGDWIGTSPSASADRPAGELRIGVVLSLSGRNQGVGRAMQGAIEQAVRDAVGRIPRLPSIRLEWGDDQGTARQASSETRRLAQAAGVSIFLGGSGSNQALAMAQVCVRLSLLCLTPSATHTQLEHMGPLVFRFLPSNETMAAFLARVAVQDLKLQEVALLTNVSNAFSTDLARAFRKHYESAGGRVLQEVVYDAETPPGTVLARTGTAPAVFLPDNQNMTVPIVTVWAEKAPSRPVFLGPDSWSIPEVWALFRRYGLTAYYVTYYDPTAPAWRDFAQRLRKKPEEVSAFEGAAYDSMTLLLEAVARAESPTPAAVAQVLRQMSLEGVTGRVRFRQSQSADHELFVLQVLPDRLRVVVSSVQGR
ncbi:MAG: ABC transporter substrate-binding protein [Acidobacteria bacterium]|nr:ABC transporter substrate-binding protein [Acidobacteriota bacterium]MDW7985110.1 ABC transporter substrate-binding protein [Acidobacteriota bacterium]